MLLAMRDSGDIGDDAFHTLENELDWMEVSDPLRAANADDVGGQLKLPLLRPCGSESPTRATACAS